MLRLFNKKEHCTLECYGNSGFSRWVLLLSQNTSFKIQCNTKHLFAVKNNTHQYTSVTQSTLKNVSYTLYLVYMFTSV